MARPKGTITLIHRADRLDAILAELWGRAGEIVIFPLWPGAGKAAKRVIVRARKGVATPTRLAAGLVLHETDGRYTAAAEAVLRDGAGLGF
jgi:tRNA1(Val) A37 N6-methylase TrmN6